MRATPKTRVPNSIVSPWNTDKSKPCCRTFWHTWSEGDILLRSSYLLCLNTRLDGLRNGGSGALRTLGPILTANGDTGRVGGGFAVVEEMCGRRSSFVEGG